MTNHSFGKVNNGGCLKPKKKEKEVRVPKKGKLWWECGTGLGGGTKKREGEGRSFIRSLAESGIDVKKEYTTLLHMGRGRGGAR